MYIALEWHTLVEMSTTGCKSGLKLRSILGVPENLSFYATLEEPDSDVGVRKGKIGLRRTSCGQMFFPR